VVMGAGIAEAGPWLRMVSLLDGTSRVLLEGDELGGRPVGGAVTADGRVLLVVAEPDSTTAEDATRWRLLDVDGTDGTRRDTGVGGVIGVAVQELRADFADDAGSFVVWDAMGTFPATLVRSADGRQTPVAMPARPGRSLGFRAFPGGAVELWDDGLFAVIDRAGNTTQAISVHQRPVRDVAISPDGRWAVTAGAGDEVYRWDVDPASGRWYGPELLLGHSDDVVGVEVDAAGRHLATVSLDRTAIIWDISEPTAPVMRGADDPGGRLDAVCAIVGRDFTPGEWRRILPDRAWQPTCSDGG
jgi:WD40 repeat protein